MSETLKLCPICKGSVKVVHFDWHNEYAIECEGCAMSYGLYDNGEMYRGADNKVELIKDYNRRAENLK